MKLFLSSLLALALSVPVAAQSCSELSVTGDGTPGTTLTFDVTGADDNSFALLAISSMTGMTTINFGMLGSLELGLDRFIVVPMGRTDGNGDVSRDFNIPAMLSTARRDLFGQAFTIDFSIMNRTLNFCTSDVEGFGIGANS